MLPRCTFLLVVLSASIAASPQGQTSSPDPQSTPTFKAKARLVLVDVVVTNNKGEPVTGLKKEEFEVLEDGKPQPVSNFEERKGAPPTQIKLPSMPPNVYTNFPLVQTADSVNVILLDALNTPTSDQVYVHKGLASFSSDGSFAEITQGFTLKSSGHSISQAASVQGTMFGVNFGPQNIFDSLLGRNDMVTLALTTTQ